MVALNKVDKWISTLCKGALIGEWHSIHCCQPVPAKSKPTAIRNEGTKKVSHLPTPCYNCGKTGHRAVDCWFKRWPPGPPAPLYSSGDWSPRPDVRDIKPVVYYNCQEVGHKSPKCPKPSKVRRPEVSKRVQTQHLWRVSTKEVIATCGRREFPVMLDTRASITILPKGVVNQEDITGVVIHARSANETTISLEDALE